MKKTTLALICSLMAFAVGTVMAQEKPQIKTSDGWITVDSIKSDPGGTITFMKGGVPKTITPAQILEAKIPDPSDLRTAATLMAQDPPAYDAAIPRLEKVIKEYRNLQHDVGASVMLARCYLGKGDAAAAVTVYDKLAANNPTANDDPLVRGGRWEASIKSGKYGRVQNELESAITGPDRKLAAVAQMRRGDLNMEKKDYDAAIMDYMRTMLFFKNDANTETRAEATYRAAEALRFKKDNRSATLFKRVGEEFPGTVWAAKAANL